MKIGNRPVERQTTTHSPTGLNKDPEVHDSGLSRRDAQSLKADLYFILAMAHYSQRGRTIDESPRRREIS